MKRVFDAVMVALISVVIWVIMAIRHLLEWTLPRDMRQEVTHPAPSPYGEPDDHDEYPRFQRDNRKGH